MDKTRYQEEGKRTKKHKTIIDFVPCFNESFCLLSLAYFNGNFVSLTITFKLQDFSYLLDCSIELLEVLLKMTVIIGIKHYVVTSMQSVLTHGNINNCDDKMFILVDSVSTLSIMNGSNLTPTFKNQIGHIVQN